MFKSRKSVDENSWGHRLKNGVQFARGYISLAIVSAGFTIANWGHIENFTGDMQREFYIATNFVDDDTAWFMRCYDKLERGEATCEGEEKDRALYIASRLEPTDSDNEASEPLNGLSVEPSEHNEECGATLVDRVIGRKTPCLPDGPEN